MTTPDPLDAAVTVLTPPGRGALAVVGICGPAAAGMIERLFTPRSGRPVGDRVDGTLAVGRWQSDGATAGEELVVVRRRPDLLEVHCHGGHAATSAVIDSLVGLGARPLAWPAWLARAGVSEIEREARETLADAGGPQAARILCRQLAGTLAAEFDRIAGLAVAGDAHGVAAATRRLHRAARVGLRLVRPWRVVLAGRVNAGKSSLVNALAGHARSLVSPRPGTTRDLVETRLVLGGWEIDLVDSAGLREPAADTERAGIARAIAARAEADLVLEVVAADDSGGLTAVGADLHGSDSPPRLIVVTKCDLASVAPPSGGVATSAVTRGGIDTLATTIIERLVPEASAEPELLAGAVPFTPRQVARLDALAAAVRPQDHR
jgi:tRNA modification GTPase